MSSKEKVNILLVDDQPAKLMTYEAMLGELGENLIKASSGREALEHLLKTDITIVLIDVSMPVLDGFELAEIIRQHPRYQKTAIIFVSAVHLTDVDILKGYESGAVDYVSVPVIPALLRAKVSVFAELYRQTRESERLNRELEQRVAERTAMLEASAANETELAARLREADRRKDEFLALLAHELRNPLAPVANAAEILRKKSVDDPELAWCQGVIERQVRQLTRLVDDLLDVSRITRGKITLRKERVDLAEVVAAAIETSQPVIEGNRHRLEVHLPAQPIVLEGDPARLTQVVANLLNNAAKFQQEGGSIDLDVTREGAEAVIAVRDSGFGIPEDQLTGIFSLFSQGEQAADRSRGGLGIGLSVVKNLVDLHGGWVHASSAGIGHGSKFVVRLPCPEVAAAPGGNGRPAALAPAPVSPLRVLVVDDNVDAAQSLAILLKMNGHDVTTVHSGSAALETALQTRPSVVLMDIGLPGMDGYEVCRRIRESGLPDTRIIAISGYGQDRDRDRAKDAGFDSHMTKPVDFAELSRILST